MKRWYYIVKEDGNPMIEYCGKKYARFHAKHHLLYFPITAHLAAQVLAFCAEEKNS